MSSGYHSSWTVPEEHRESAEYIEAGQRMALAEAVYDRRTALGWTVRDLAAAAGLSEEQVESIEESAVDPTLSLIEKLAAALDVQVRIDPAREPAITFEAHAA